jgi:hypothetical protein
MKKYSADEFERVQISADKVQYRHIANGKMRVELIKLAKEGFLSPEQMRAEASNFKYLFSESEYLDAISQETSNMEHMDSELICPVCGLVTTIEDGQGEQRPVECQECFTQRTTVMRR